MNTWFLFHCWMALCIWSWDMDGTLEARLNKFEETVGIYTPPETEKERE